MSANTCRSIASAFLPQLCSLVFWIFLILPAVFPSNGLRLTNMSAPRIIDYTEDMTLECQFDMGDEELYSVKWYKDGNEFFRYMPHDQPHMKTFPVPGVYLEESLSLCGQDRCSVRLSNLVRVESSGAYQCEVSSEAPAFRLASETHNVTVAALPNENPSIEGVDESYFVGDILSAKCISPPTDPPQLLTWYINKEQVPNKLVRDMKTFKEDNRGLTTRSLLLRFAIEQKYSRGIPLELTCASAFAGVPETSRTVTKSISLFDHAAQILNNQKFSWNSSSFTIYDSCLILLLGALRWFLD